MARRLPDDPIIRSLVQHARAAQLTRRSVLAGAGAGAAALALAACAPAAAKKLSVANDVSATDKSLIWANWPEYLDQADDKSYPTLDAFEKQTGIKVTYNVDVQDNNTYYAKVKNQLALGQDIGADTVVLTDWMVDRLIRFGYVQELDHANIPNLANLLPDLQNPDFDPGRKFSVPWQGGFAGLCWNIEKVPNGLKSVADLWKPELKGKVGVLSEMRDTVGLLMLANGTDISGTWGDTEFENALDVLKAQISSGQIRTVKGNDYIQDLESEDTWAAIVWSGDISVLNAEVGSEKWKFAIPDSGGTIWNDNFVVPVGSSHLGNVEKLIDYYYEPEVAATVADWVNYITPVVGAQDAMKKIDPDLADDWLIFPDEEVLKTVKRFRSLTPADDQKYQTQFQALLVS